MATGCKELALPEGSRRIFELVLPLVLEFIPPESVVLGGGSALAARWKHRESVDIDLFTSQTTFTEAIFRRSARFETRLEQLGFGRVATLGPEGCTIYLQDARVDLVAVSPVTHPSRSTDCTPSPRVALETNLEILAKKLHRRMILHGRIVPRDLYDFAYARRFEPAIMNATWSTERIRDPQVLAAALSSFSPGWMQRHEVPVINPRYPDLLENAVEAMIDDILSRFPVTRDPWGR